MGCGRVGSTLAVDLEKSGHTVAVIDQNREAFRRLGANFNGRTVAGVGFDRDTLLEAGIEKADAFAAVSNGDNSNILAARVARENFGVKNVVARIYDPGRAEIYQRLGIPTVATVLWTTDQIMRRLTPDGAKLDKDGAIWLLGRVDDVMNVSGHRISTTEVESALVSHPSVAEAAVVGANDAMTGQAIIAYVTLRGGLEVDEKVLREHVAKEIGPIAKPKMIFFTPDLPKTRSGKIMRRLLRDVAEGRNIGDTTTLADASVVSELQRRATESPTED